MPRLFTVCKISGQKITTIMEILCELHQRLLSQVDGNADPDGTSKTPIATCVWNLLDNGIISPQWLSQDVIWRVHRPNPGKNDA